jgi:SAM-dependent methyltransferase
VAGDAWSSGEAYEGYMGRWSRTVAEQFVSWLAPQPAADWVDVGCGTGAVTSAVLAAAEPAGILAVDPSEDLVSHLRDWVDDERVEPRMGDGLAVPVVDSAADYVVSGLVLNFLPAPAAALAEWRRVARPGATVAAYVWDYAEGMQMLRAFWDAAVSLDPGALDLDEAVRFPLCRPDRLRHLFSRAGLADVEDREIVVPTVFASFDHFWTPFLSGQGPAPGYCSSLPPAALERLRARLGTMLGTRFAPDGGPIRLTARAWAIRGTSPG